MDNIRLHRLLSGLTFALALSLSSSALAEARVVVRPFSGPHAAQVRSAVERELAHNGAKVVPSEAADRVAKRRRVRIDGTSGRREVARELEISAWIEGRVRRKGKKFEATITVRDGADNAEVGQTSFVRKKPKQLDQAVKQRFWRELGAAVESARPPEEASEPEPEQPEPVAAQESDTSSFASSAVAAARDEETPPGFSGGDEEQQIDGEQEDEKGPRTVSALEAAFTMNTLHRTLRFNDALTQGLGDYALAAAPMADIGARFYPGAFFSQGFASYIGLDLHAQMAFALKSKDAQGVEYPTSYSGYGAGLIGRYPLKRHELNAMLGYNAQSFKVNDAKGQAAPVPNVEYRSVRMGLGAKLAVVDRLKLGLEAAWLFLSAKGELVSQNWFPRASGAGLEGALYADVSLMGALNARARVAYQRDFFSFNSKPGDQHVAGGAVDNYVSGGLGLSYTY